MAFRRGKFQRKSQEFVSWYNTTSVFDYRHTGDIYRQSLTVKLYSSVGGIYAGLAVLTVLLCAWLKKRRYIHPRRREAWWKQQKAISSELAEIIDRHQGLIYEMRRTTRDHKRIEPPPPEVWDIHVPASAEPLQGWIDMTVVYEHEQKLYMQKLAQRRQQQPSQGDASNNNNNNNKQTVPPASWTDMGDRDWLEPGGLLDNARQMVGVEALQDVDSLAPVLDDYDLENPAVISDRREAEPVWDFNYMWALFISLGDYESRQIFTHAQQFGWTVTEPVTQVLLAAAIGRLVGTQDLTAYLLVTILLHLSTLLSQGLIQALTTVCASSVQQEHWYRAGQYIQLILVLHTILMVPVGVLWMQVMGHVVRNQKLDYIGAAIAHHYVRIHVIRLLVKGYQQALRQVLRWEGHDQYLHTTHLFEQALSVGLVVMMAGFLPISIMGVGWVLLIVQLVFLGVLLYHIRKKRWLDDYWDGMKGGVVLENIEVVEYYLRLAGPLVAGYILQYGWTSVVFCIVLTQIGTAEAVAWGLMTIVLDAALAPARALAEAAFYRSSTLLADAQVLTAQYSAHKCVYFALLVGFLVAAVMVVITYFVRDFLTVDIMLERMVATAMPAMAIAQWCASVSLVCFALLSAQVRAALATVVQCGSIWLVGTGLVLYFGLSRHWSVFGLCAATAGGWLVSALVLFVFLSCSHWERRAAKVLQRQVMLNPLKDNGPDFDRYFDGVVAKSNQATEEAAEGGYVSMDDHNDKKDRGGSYRPVDFAVDGSPAGGAAPAAGAEDFDQTVDRLYYDTKDLAVETAQKAVDDAQWAARAATKGARRAARATNKHAVQPLGRALTGVSAAVTTAAIETDKATAPTRQAVMEATAPARQAVLEATAPAREVYAEHADAVMEVTRPTRHALRDHATVGATVVSEVTAPMIQAVSSALSIDLGESSSDEEEAQELETKTVGTNKSAPYPMAHDPSGIQVVSQQLKGGLTAEITVAQDAPPVKSSSASIKSTAIKSLAGSVKSKKSTAGKPTKKVASNNESIEIPAVASALSSDSLGPITSAPMGRHLASKTSSKDDVLDHKLPAADKGPQFPAKRQIPAKREAVVDGKPKTTESVVDHKLPSPRSPPQPEKKRGGFFGWGKKASGGGASVSSKKSTKSRAKSPTGAASVSSKQTANDKGKNPSSSASVSSKQTANDKGKNPPISSASVSSKKQLPKEQSFAAGTAAAGVATVASFASASSKKNAADSQSVTSKKAPPPKDAPKAPSELDTAIRAQEASGKPPMSPKEAVASIYAPPAADADPDSPRQTSSPLPDVTKDESFADIIERELTSKFSLLAAPSDEVRGKTATPALETKASGTMESQFMGMFGSLMGNESDKPTAKSAIPASAAAKSAIPPSAAPPAPASKAPATPMGREPSSMGVEMGVDEFEQGSTTKRRAGWFSSSANRQNLEPPTPGKAPKGGAAVVAPPSRNQPATRSGGSRPSSPAQQRGGSRPSSPFSKASGKNIAPPVPKQTGSSSRPSSPFSTSSSKGPTSKATAKGANRAASPVSVSSRRSRPTQKEATTPPRSTGKPLPPPSGEKPSQKMEVFTAAVDSKASKAPASVSSNKKTAPSPEVRISGRKAGGATKASDSASVKTDKSGKKKPLEGKRVSNEDDFEVVGHEACEF